MAISNSYGGGEWSGETSYDAYYNHAGTAVTVSSGDGGYGVDFPAASQYVTAVGGTSLYQLANSGGRTTGSTTETAWTGAGSGCSAYIPKPVWQTDTGCSRRTVADVSAVADPNTGLLGLRQRKLVHIRRDECSLTDHRFGLRPGGQRRDRYQSWKAC